MCPASAFAGNEDDYVPIVKYRIGEGDEIVAELQEIGTWTNNKQPYAQNNNVYLTILPYGSTISSCTVAGGSSYTLAFRLYGKNTGSVTNIDNFFTNPEYFISGEEFHGLGLDSDSHEYARFFFSRLDNVDSVKERIPTSEDYKGFCLRPLVKKDGQNVQVPAIIVQISTIPPSVEPISTEALQAEVARVTSGSAIKFYQKDDRYNGKSYNKGGFWAAMQTSLLAANACIANPSSEEEVETVTKNLKSAIDNLIPINQVNPTSLYEELKKNEDLVWWGTRAVERSFLTGDSEYVAVEQKTTSLATWQLFAEKRNAAKWLLESLYDADGNPTEINSSTHDGFETLKLQVEAATSELSDAIKYLDRLAEDADRKRIDNDLKGIKLYADTICAGLEEGSFTADSWSNFTGKRDAAVGIAAGYTNANGVGVLEGQKIRLRFNEFRDAFYSLVETKPEITVHFSAVDNYAAHTGKPSVAVKTCDLKVTPGTTIDDVLKQTGVYEGFKTAIGRYNNACSQYTINIMSSRTAQQFLGGDKVVNNATLKDGDTLVATLQYVPALTYADGSMGISLDISPSRSELSAPAGTLEAGKSFVVNAKSTGSAPENYTGTMLPMEGATVFSSTPCGSLEEAKSAAVTERTDGITDASGNASVTLYSEGWYALNVFDLGEEGGFCSGRPIFIEVGASSNTVAVKAALKEELNTLAAKYEENFFAAEDWAVVKEKHEQGLELIENAATSGEARTAQQEAVKAICDIHAKAEKYNEENLKHFRQLLEGLPEDISKLDKTAEGRIKSLIKRYGDMTAHQQSQLTPVEVERYENIKAAYEAGLPEAKNYTVTVESKAADGADSADIEALSDMISWLMENSPQDDSSPDAESMQVPPLNTPILLKSEFMTSGNPRGFTYELAASEGMPADTSVDVCLNPDMAAYFHVRRGTLPADRAWSISAEDITITNNQTNCSMNGEMRYTINGKEWEIRSIESNIPNPVMLTEPLHDTSTFKGKENTAYRLYIPESFMRFRVPYEDVRIIVTWGPVGGTESEISAARETALASVEAAYNSYEEADYSQENWQALADARAAGIASIREAKTLQEVNEKRLIAIGAMSAIAKQQGLVIPNASNIDLPDYGQVVGSVHIVVENRTFKSEISDGSIPAWHGTLIDGWYDLCERDTMMTSILKALQLKGCNWSTGSQGIADKWDDYDIGYLASVKVPQNVQADGSDFVLNNHEESLGEFSGEPGSGWMGCLNDWFTNFGFNEFSYSNRSLMDGDEIRVMFTQNLGVDLGGSWGNADTGLKELIVDGGRLSPVFNSSKREYILTIDGERANVMISPTASNKNYMVKTFLNAYNKDSAFYRRSERIPVTSGDTIYIGCGDRSWPSMNKQESEAIDYTGTIYTIKVYRGGKEGVEAQIAALPDASKITLARYKNCKPDVEAARNAYNALTDKEGIDIERLVAAEEAVKKFSEIDNVKTLLSGLIQNSRATDGQVIQAKAAIEAADAAYKALTAEQKGYITKGDVSNYNALVERLSALTATAAAPIEGTEFAPGGDVLAPKSELSGTEATASVTEDEISSAVEAAKSGDSSALTIAPTGADDAKSVAVNIPTSAAKNMAKEEDLGLNVETAIGSVAIPSNALKSVSEQAEGDKIEIIVEEKVAEDVKNKAGAEDIDTEDALIVGVTIKSGNKAISDFGGHSLEILIPVTGDKHKEGETYKVIIVSGSGNIESTVGRCEKRNGKLVVVVRTTHLSTFIVTSQKGVLFRDAVNHWAMSAIQYAFDKNIMTGVGAGEFDPEGTFSRAMLATMLYRLEGRPSVSGMNNPFSDVAAGQWYTDAIIWAAKNNIVNGYGGGLFGPSDDISREQMATMLLRYSKYKKYDTSKKGSLAAFADAKNISAWALDGMKWANAEGLVTGHTASLLAPAGTATRAEAATLLMRFMTNVVK